MFREAALIGLFFYPVAGFCFLAGLVDPGFFLPAALAFAFPTALLMGAVDDRNQQIRYKTHSKKCGCRGCWEDNNLSQR